MFAMFKAGLVPVNTNYRYTDDELAYLWEQRRRRRRGLPRHVHRALRGHARPRATACARGSGSTTAASRAPTGRSTTRPRPPPPPTAACRRRGAGRPTTCTCCTPAARPACPKGVMWRQDDMVGSLDAPSKHPLPALPGLGRVRRPHRQARPAQPAGGAADARHRRVQRDVEPGARPDRSSPSSGATSTRSSCSTPSSAHRVNSISIVGDAFAKPILRALDAEPDRWDISSLRVIVSSGVIWAAETKAGLLRHNARLIMIDSLGSSEAIGMATNTTTARQTAAGATAQVHARAATPGCSPRTDAKWCPAAASAGGWRCAAARPIGYYKDEAKSASTFITFDGVRWSIPGDWAEVEADGTVRLIGRGSQCINTGGEKVYPEEVEEVLEAAPLRRRRSGGRRARRALRRGHHRARRAARRRHHRRGRRSSPTSGRTLAAYKSPKRVLAIDTHRPRRQRQARLHRAEGRGAQPPGHPDQLNGATGPGALGLEPAAVDSFDVLAASQPDPVRPEAHVMADLGFDGKVVIITGAGGGLGRQHALLLA